MSDQILITKSNGEIEPFDENKLRRSLLKAGASVESSDKVISHISTELKNGITTNEIYRHAFSFLHKTERPVAARYSLRKALAEFGPTGFPFEKFIAEIFKTQGFQVATDQLVMGRCVQHEVDVVAWNANKLIMVESKFHNDASLKSDLKVVLYVKARFDDLSEQNFNYGKPDRPLDEGYIITNTKFSENAILYGQCAGVNMIGWNYPKKGNLQDIVHDSGLHPITCLIGLSNIEKLELLGQGIVLCRDVMEADKLENLGLARERAEEIAAEAEAVCGISQVQN